MTFKLAIHPDAPLSHFDDPVEWLEAVLLKMSVVKPESLMGWWKVQSPLVVEAERASPEEARRVRRHMLVLCAGNPPDDILELMAARHDAEQSAQMGEPSPWRDDLGGQDAEWKSERRVAMMCALQAVGLA